MIVAPNLNHKVEFVISSKEAADGGNDFFVNAYCQCGWKCSCQIENELGGPTKARTEAKAAWDNHLKE